MVLRIQGWDIPVLHVHITRMRTEGNTKAVSDQDIDHQKLN